MYFYHIFCADKFTKEILNFLVQYYFNWHLWYIEPSLKDFLLCLSDTQEKFFQEIPLNSMVDWRRKYIAIRLECKVQQKRKAGDSRKKNHDTFVIKIVLCAWKSKQVLMFLQWTSYVCLVQKYLPGFILLNGVLIAVNVIFLI